MHQVAHDCNIYSLTAISAYGIECLCNCIRIVLLLKLVRYSRAHMQIMLLSQWCSSLVYVRFDTLPTRNTRGYGTHNKFLHQITV